LFLIPVCDGFGSAEVLMTLEAVIFGGMGSLAECAELDRAAWNAAFRMHDVPWEWSWDTYGELMRPGGDRQLAARYAAHLGEVLEAEALDATHQRFSRRCWPRRCRCAPVSPACWPGPRGAA
jgi:hypothetical protein